ncbi:MAG: class I SAM-dependent methyltransferase [Flavobacteriales bacterium]|nr:class I SAM-dependent methyltransferase [Flavobacteriales bacterium]MCB9168426.1 class I SAM-dependent methyltransferase [Flavobacteriales bacterium]
MSYTDYDTIGTGYDTTRKADPYLAERLAALLALAPGAQVLDVGCGTGNYTTALEQRGSRMTGLDPSERMLEEARGKSSTITWVNGRSEDLPFPNAVFDGAIATLTTHHWDDLTMGFRQMHRVLRKGAPLVILTSTPEQMRGYWLCHYFPGILERSCAVMPTAEATLAALETAGFHDIELEPYDVRSDLQDLFLYSAKEDPTRYLDEGFRGGISTFAALTGKVELEKGLRRLHADITSGEWSRVRAFYAHEGGDYLFVKAVT